MNYIQKGRHRLWRRLTWSKVASLAKIETKMREKMRQ